MLLYLCISHQNHKPITSNLSGLQIIQCNFLSNDFELMTGYFVSIEQQGPQMKSCILTTPLLFIILENFMAKYTRLSTFIKSQKKLFLNKFYSFYQSKTVSPKVSYGLLLLI